MADDHEAITDEDDDSDNGFQPELQGVLFKWTNYIHGWQKRFIVLKDGTLSYYKSREEQGFGCRGALSLFKATIKPHEFDECRFDVSVNDCVWYLRAETPEDKQHWVDILEAFKAESGYNSECSLRRHGSAVSLTSVTLSAASASSFKKCRDLKLKLAEMETYRDILCSQMDTLQRYFDSCADRDLKKQKLDDEAENINGKVAAVDFKGEAMTFKATSGAVLTGLAQCIEAITKREEMWKRKLEKEHQRLLRLEETCLLLRDRKSTKVGPDQEVPPMKPIRNPAIRNPPYKISYYQLLSMRQIVNPLSLPRRTPPCCHNFCLLSRAQKKTRDVSVQNEGPHSTLGDEEFYDAVETGLERIEEEVALRELLRQSSMTEPPPSLDNATSHPLWSEIERVTKEQVHYASLGVGEGGWQLFAEEGDMKMYRREEELNGLVIDPLKACHIVKGVTGREMCHYFFSPQYRKDWETTLEQMTVVEKISDNILVFLQVHKRVWPTAQRDALFWSHTTHMTDPKDHDGHDIWAVVNHSTQLPQYPQKSNKCVRVALTVCLYCQTLITPPKDGAQVSRDDITCKITYCAVVNPGGWVPASALRALYKREYPKFLKRFTAYVITQTKDKPIMF